MSYSEDLKEFAQTYKYESITVQMIRKSRLIRTASWQET